MLPFVIARIFRPTFLAVFDLTNLQLGTAFSIYGFVAAIAYFTGEPLADRFSARRLMAIALFSTAIGGIVFASVPSIGVLSVLYGFWGLTTILLFWAALIRATRIWGGDATQGQAYGILDSGRGLVSALLASISVAIFAALLPNEIDVSSLADRKAALSWIIWIFSGLTLGTAILVYFAIPENKAHSSSSTDKDRFTLEGLKAVIRMPAVWLQALIVVCAYVGYKCTDDFSLFAYDVFGYNDIEAARIGTITFWVRPFAALGAGLLGDRFRPSRVLALGFGLLIAGSLVMASGQFPLHIPWILIVTIISTSLAIYSLRGLYFAIFGEAKVPVAFTGSAVGVVSVIGFTPDIFMGPLMGYLLDRSQAY